MSQKVASIVSILNYSSSQLSDSSPTQMLCSQESVELYEKEGVFTYEEFAQEDCREIHQPRI
jgi:hypothetical protein